MIVGQCDGEVKKGSKKQQTRSTRERRKSRLTRLWPSVLTICLDADLLHPNVCDSVAGKFLRMKRGTSAVNSKSPKILKAVIRLVVKPATVALLSGY